MIGPVLALSLLSPQDGAVTLDGHFPFAPPATLKAWEGRRKRLRRQVLVAAGLWPMPARTLLEPVVHGRIERAGYSVEKARIEALPGFYVTGNLYRPDRAGPHPGVLCPHGHWADGRFSERSDDEVRAEIARGEEVHLANGRYHLQARCAQLARMGCVVFHYDMTGYADSVQLDHRDSLGSVQDELHSLSHFGLQTWSSIRALDFLAGLEDVDAERLGVTGASGGGTQTFVLCAIDDRPKVALPAVMVSTSMQGGCECENASHLRVGTGNVELAALAAPRAYALTGANDWTVDIERDGLPGLKKVWGFYGAADRVEAWCYPKFPHNYNLVSRLRMYAWFDRHLGLGATHPIVERPLEPVAPGALSFYAGGQARPGRADVDDLRAAWVDATAPTVSALVPRTLEEVERWREVVGGALGVLVHARLTSVFTIAEQGPGTILLRHVEGTRSTVRVAVRAAAGAQRCTVVRLAGDPSPPPEDPADVEWLTVERRAGPAPVDESRHAGFSGYTHGYNRTLLAQRVDDLSTTITQWSDGAAPLRLWGDRDSALPILLAAALAPGLVDRVAIEWPADFAAIESADDERFLPGALRFGGMPAFASLLAPAELRICGIDEVPELVRAVYAASGRPDAVRVATRAELAEWITSE
ncbi:MAG: hypothetical protein GY711_34380 [bacterium]|nr:hypothetical protein [bacterium]